MGLFDKIESKKKEKWTEEILTADNAAAEVFHFKRFEEWQLLYDPEVVKKKEKKEREEEEKKKGTGKAAKYIITKILNKINTNLKKNIALKLYELVGQLAEIGAQACVEKQELKAARFLNAIVALALTYRYESKNQDKFVFFRELALDQIALSTNELAVEVEMKKRDVGGAAAQKLDDLEGKKEQLEAKEEVRIAAEGSTDDIVELITGKIYTIIQEKKGELKKKMESEPIVFVGGSKSDIDPGVLQLMELLQGTLEGKVDILIVKIKDILRLLVTTVVQSRDKVRAQVQNACEKAKDKANTGQDQAMAAKEFTPGLGDVRAQLAAHTAKAVQFLLDAIGRYVDNFTEMLSSAMITEPPAEDS
eukprot:Nk52_evm72s1992 gene=Nk52_evmTU72s1992